jgi:5-oxoprolinase (ATP-hydrolysing) subunit C
MAGQEPAGATLRVLRPGTWTLVVDRGRPHCRSLGVPVGGAADRFALAVGNALVGNAPGDAALEFSLVGPTLRADGPLACVVYGAPFELGAGPRRLTAGTTFTLGPGEELRVGGTPLGVRGYLCVRGGLRTPAVLGSRSSLEPLRAGADLPCLPGAIGGRFVRVRRGEGQGRGGVGRAGMPARPDGAAPRREVTTLRVLEGPQASWFRAEEFYAPPDAPASPAFTVAPASNRMGLRLSGPPLTTPARELVSEPVCPGTVQVTRDGQCIILGVDGQTIGGYPKVAQVISADLDELGQLRPGDRVCFRRVGLAEAEALYRDREALLRAWLLRLRAD